MLRWAWEMTPREMFADTGRISVETASTLTIETTPFTCERKALPGTSFTYQLALAERSRSVGMREVREAQPELPVSGDKRSGVLVFAGENLIASLIRPGHKMRHGGRTFVQPEYRRQGLAVRMASEFFWATKHPRTPLQLQYTPHNLAASLAAHKNVVLRAVQEGMPVPEHVLAAVTEGAEAASMLAAAQKVQHG